MDIITANLHTLMKEYRNVISSKGSQPDELENALKSTLNLLGSNDNYSDVVYRRGV